MERANKSFYKVILILIGAFVLLMGVISFIYPGGVYPDPGWGFTVMRSMQHGGDFNLLTRPDPQDLSKNVSDYLTWWSPGQYLVPYTFISLFKLNIGQANALAITLSQLIGLAGFFSLFRKLGFTPIIAAVSVAFMACQQFFTLPYLFYNGGEILAFAFSGWFLYGCTALTRTGWQLLLFSLTSGLIAFFCKSALMWLYFAGLCYLWIRISITKPLGKWLVNGIWIAIPATLSLAIIYFTFLSKGQNPASESLGFNFSWSAITFPLASPLLSGFSVDDLFNGLIFHNDKPVLNPYWSLIALIMLAAISVLIILIIIRYIANNTYRLLVVILYCTSTLFFGYLFLKQMNVSMEARHLRIIGLVIIPGVIHLVSSLRLPYRFFFGLLWLFIAFTSFKVLFHGIRYDAVSGVRGPSGIAQQAIDQPSLNYILALDKQYKDAIFVFISNDTGLEILHNRVVNLDPIGPEVKIDYDDYVHYGYAGPIFILLPTSYTGPKASIILKSFPGYKGFKLIDLTADYVLYQASMKR